MPEPTQADLDNHANQCNPNHSEYNGYQDSSDEEPTQADLDNHANQCNPNHSEYNGYQDSSDEE